MVSNKEKELDFIKLHEISLHITKDSINSDKYYRKIREIQPSYYNIIIIYYKFLKFVINYENDSLKEQNELGIVIQKRRIQNLRTMEFQNDIFDLNKKIGIVVLMSGMKNLGRIGMINYEISQITRYKVDKLKNSNISLLFPSVIDEITHNTCLEQFFIGKNYSSFINSKKNLWIKDSNGFVILVDFITQPFYDQIKGLQFIAYIKVSDQMIIKDQELSAIDIFTVIVDQFGQIKNSSSNFAALLQFQNSQDMRNSDQNFYEMCFDAQKNIENQLIQEGISTILNLNEQEFNYQSDDIPMQSNGMFKETEINDSDIEENGVKISLENKNKSKMLSLKEQQYSKYNFVSTFAKAVDLLIHDQESQKIDQIEGSLQYDGSVTNSSQWEILIDENNLQIEVVNLINLQPNGVVSHYDYDLIPGIQQLISKVQMLIASQNQSCFCQFRYQDFQKNYTFRDFERDYYFVDKNAVNTLGKRVFKLGQQMIQRIVDSILSSVNQNNKQQKNGNLNASKIKAKYSDIISKEVNYENFDDHNSLLQDTEKEQVIGDDEILEQSINDKRQFESESGSQIQQISQTDEKEMTLDQKSLIQLKKKKRDNYEIRLQEIIQDIHQRFRAQKILNGIKIMILSSIYCMFFVALYLINNEAKVQTKNSIEAFNTILMRGPCLSSVPLFVRQRLIQNQTVQVEFLNNSIDGLFDFCQQNYMKIKDLRKSQPLSFRLDKNLVNKYEDQQLCESSEKIIHKDQNLVQIELQVCSQSINGMLNKGLSQSYTYLMAEFRKYQIQYENLRAPTDSELKSLINE
ncbi:UNKNOWN [Stylonychia lemnae]|uniref:Transmembrane protein n=1 Tax=Stylonychia lemnae TaxID=5949 RepID=A0A077ZTB0_STYLE|nr:UNKNOWN [Stylonychia lemnae]|eukprot:CDW73123.1 UNKNOWN [Stylonychia lemnae]